MLFFTVMSCLIIFITLSLILKVLWALHQTNCNSKVCLVGKVALVTGGSDGIGYQIVLGLASRGCRVIIADCNVNESIKDTICKETHNPNIILKYINLASFRSVREFAEDLKKTEDKLDILINNAGIAQGRSVRTEDGITQTMQVNYYSAFLLTHLLLDLLKKSPSGGRIINTTSLMSFLHMLTTKTVRKNGIENGYELFSYSISKFCQISASETFAEKLKKYGVTSNCFHPYAAKTNIFQASLNGAHWYEYIIIFTLDVLALIAAKTPEEAAQTGIFLACANEVKSVTGEFFGEMKPTWKPPRTHNQELCEAIWTESERVVKLTSEEKIS